MPKPLLKTSVRELIGFVLRSGDLAAGGFSCPDRMVEGTRGHQKVQNARPDDYQPEVPVSYLVETEEIALEISGRIDGLLAEEDSTVLVDEIKTTDADPEEDPPENPAHWAQAKVYAFIVAEHYLHVSGVMAVVTAGLVVGSIGRTAISPDAFHALHETWGQLGFWATSVIFVLVGLAVPDLLSALDNELLIGLIVVILIATIARVVVIYGLIPVVSALRVG